MSSFIKKIFENKIDVPVHAQFQKFSRGVFTGRAMVKASKGPKGYSVTTTAEYANDLVRIVAEKLGSGSTEVSGVVVTTLDLRGKLPSTSLKQFMGIKQYVIEGKMTGHEIIGLLDKSPPEAFFALTFNAGDTLLKIKPKAPKSAKPSTSDAGPKVDFCSLKTTDVGLVHNILFDAPATWKKIEITHTYNITDIELPSGVTEPNELRRLAKRKGMLIRKAVVDGATHNSEKAFVA